MNRINALAYDYKCKKVLCDKRLLSYVLKLAVEEYKGLSIEEIEPLIESGVVMEEDTHILFPRVNEDVDENGKKTIFDILLTSKYPNSDNSIDTIINLEMQNDALPKSKDHKSYSLIKRGIFYVGKMIVNQKGVTFTSNNYQNLKKVNSIWICSRPKKDKENSVQRYKIHEEHVLGKMIEELQDNYDMINVCMINLGKDGSVYELEPLNELFVRNNSSEEKYKNLQEKYGIKVYDETKGEIQEMCNFSKGIYADGLEQGIEQGLEKGIEQGILSSIQGLMNSLSIGLEEAMKLLQLSEEMRNKCRAIIG